MTISAGPQEVCQKRKGDEIRLFLGSCHSWIYGVLTGCHKEMLQTTACVQLHIHVVDYIHSYIGYTVWL